MYIQVALQELSKMSTAIISDAMGKMGLKDRTMRSRIKPIYPDMKVVGEVFTAKAYPGGTHVCDMALKAIQSGQVLVIDGGAFLEAVLWGEIYSSIAKSKGVKGAIIDGAVRDIEGVRKIGFPLFAAGVTPSAGTGDKLGSINIPITCGGVVVNPGDLAFGDILGVVIVPPEKAVEVLDMCYQILEKERKILEEFGVDMDLYI